MSLILEALRKSEAERRRGRMPDLHAELPPAPAPRAAAKPTWPWIAGSAAVVAVGVVAWLALTPRTEVRAAPHDAPAAPASHSAPALPPVAHLQPAPKTVERAPATTVASATPASRPAALPATPAPDARAGDDARIPSASPVATVSTSSAPAMAPPRPLPPPPPISSPSGQNGPVLALADLAPSERKALPPLKLSMHMWNDDASQRFVILDGNRLGEGDRIGEAVVTAITRDGVLLDWNGRALKVPLR